MRSSTRTRFAIALASAIVAVCSTPASPCACEPSRTHIMVYGVTKDASGVPVAGATVFVLIPNLFDPVNDPVLSPAHVTATTSSDGAFRLELISLQSPSTFPVGVLAAAVRAPGDTVRIPGFGGLLRPVGQKPDSIELNFTFPSR